MPCSASEESNDFHLDPEEAEQTSQNAKRDLNPALAHTPVLESRMKIGEKRRSFSNAVATRVDVIQRAEEFHLDPNKCNS